MSPEMIDQIKKAQSHLVIAHDMLRLGHNDEAGRAAYLAAFNAAQGYIFELTGKVVKTHNGLHDRFYLLAKDNAHFDKELLQFLSRSFRLKAIADYESGPLAVVPQEMAEQAIATAERFVALISKLLDKPL